LGQKNSQAGRSFWPTLGDLRLILKRGTADPAGFADLSGVLLVRLTCKIMSLSLVDPTSVRGYIEFMSELDDELQKALLDSQARVSETTGSEETDVVEQVGVVHDIERGAPAVSASASAETPRRNLALLAGLLVAAAGILTLVFSSVDEAAIYSMTTDKLLEQKEKFTGKNLRVEGDLVPGTLTRRDQPCEYRFNIEKNGQKLAVRFPQCVVPDTFKDVPGMAVQVTAEGKLNDEGHFDATHIMAKCPSKYEMQERAKNGEAAPHDMVLAQ